jgi:FecR protein
MAERDDDYLWDGSGPADPGVQRLERLLGRYRHAPPALEAGREPGREPELGREPEPVREPEPGRGPVAAPPSARRRRRARGPRLARWAAVLAAAGLAALLVPRWFGGGPVEGYRLSGPGARSLVRAGEELVASARETLRIGALGEVELAPDTRLRVEDTGRRAHRLYLERGRVHAKISARPRLFEIGTPSGDTIDLGCEYDLAVDDAGVARVAVTVGQIAFELDGREVYVPEGASCVSTPDRGPHAPLFDDADPKLVAAVDAVEFAADPDPAALARLAGIDRREDGLTLWHLFTSRASAPALRRAAFDGLSRLFPKPPGVTEEGLFARDPAMLARWVERMKWSWR